MSLIPNLRLLLCHMESKVARKWRFDGKQTCRLAFIFLICFGGGRGGSVLCFVCFLISPSWFLNHETRPKKGYRILNEETWMGKKPWITSICRLATRARSWMLTLIKIKLKLHWFVARQIFTKRWKDNANTTLWAEVFSLWPSIGLARPTEGQKKNLCSQVREFASRKKCYATGNFERYCSRNAVLKSDSWYSNKILTKWHWIWWRWWWLIVGNITRSVYLEYSITK